MTGYTPGSALSYPEGGDAVAVHTDVRALALGVDAELAQRPSRSELTAALDAAVAPLASTQYVDDAVEAATATVTYVGDGVYEIA